MILVIDNYDSFTYNLVQQIGEIVAGKTDIRVFRNDRLTPGDLADLQPSHLIVSPGPGTPHESGISIPALAHFAGKIPILGVCLGHQCIGQMFGATVDRAARVMHGKTSRIEHDGRTIFAGLSSGFAATRYHSLIVFRDTIRAPLEVSAWTDDDIVMGVRHPALHIEGVQFHPESYLTFEGQRLMRNFLASGHGAATPDSVVHSTEPGNQ